MKYEIKEKRIQLCIAEISHTAAIKIDINSSTHVLKLDFIFNIRLLFLRVIALFSFKHLSLRHESFVCANECLSAMLRYQ